MQITRASAPPVQQERAPEKLVFILTETGVGLHATGKDGFYSLANFKNKDGLYRADYFGYYPDNTEEIVCCATELKFCVQACQDHLNARCLIK